MIAFDRLDRDARPGFIGSVDPRSARRQLRVSLTVTAVMALAIGGSAVALRPLPGFDEASQRAGIADAAAVNHHALDASLQFGRRTGG